MSIPPPSGTGIDRLLRIMAQLRSKDGGCPWDIEQDFSTIAPYTIEEAYEVADAIEKRDMPALKDELGDLLFQVVFHGRMAEEAGLFGFEEIADAISEKMVRRHPHVFTSEAGDGTAVATAADQTVNWERMKAAERASQAQEAERHSALDGVIAGLPALTRAVKIQKRAARVGFDWTEPAPILDKIEEEIDELRAELTNGAAAERIEDELGDLIFALANLARRLDLDAEGALRRATAKFERRFRAMEALATAEGRPFDSLPLDEQDALWNRVKANEG
ncbi:nucleoside triphosphate pyrophosphohydrolase [Aliidongia dinghuensis]|uniref:Nucleoside triphosphate pyrophosphohydrolase n=1 Tax=Aliidongia dinghuensis TaxID=1867774 RepID=A0A8J2YSE1_9PROT|nr:nucleoside triphosphate pyrophosphohydrolase [Aliidongia dinghuensis]GGF14778.1 nucleoside triphosphate pyrophosphohydrolase [Aliidongia dinghuensis]